MWDFTQLEVWQRTRRLTALIYGITGAFPVAERFGLTSQMRRAANSIGANIAECCGRNGGRDRARFLEVAAASANELEHHLIVSTDIGLIDVELKTSVGA